MRNHSLFVIFGFLAIFGSLQGQTSTYNVPGDNFLTIGDYSSTNGTKGILFTGYRDVVPNYFGASIEAVNSWVCCGNYPTNGYAGVKHIGLNFNVHNPDIWTQDATITAMSITAFGNVGIGTTSPQTKLDIIGTTRIKGGELQVSGDNIDIGGTINLINTAKTANGQASNWRIYNMGGNYGNSLQFWAYDNLGCVRGGMCAPRFTIMDNNGYVGIGTSTPDQKLTVKGKIHAEEVIVDLAVPADYVFAKDYTLMPLHKVEQYVQTNNHLPDFPSANEIKQQGLNVGEMQNKLLQKIEELTLYVIAQQKEIEALKAKVSSNP